MSFNFDEWSMGVYLRLKTWRRGQRVGEDADGNVYYRDRRSQARRPRRWVVYNGGLSEASRVPPEWHAWLHYQTDEMPARENPLRRGWQQEHEPNRTGSLGAYLPPGHALRGGQRAPATGDYEAWSPGE